MFRKAWMAASDLKLTRKLTSLQALSKILLKKGITKYAVTEIIFINFQQNSLVFTISLIDFDNVFGGWAPFKAHWLYKNQKSFDEAKCSCFWMLSVSKSSYFVLIFYETFLLFHGKNYSKHGRNY